jgi:predicted DNA-binding transcriptional regulator AlpA
MNILENLPPDLARHRVLNASQSAALIGLSLPQFRREYRKGEVPQPIRLSTRRLGWRVGDIIDWLAAKQAV